MGDFNSHIGQPYSKHAPGQTNAQGQLLLYTINRSNQYIASLVDTAAGPTYTFCSDNCYTVAFYILSSRFIEKRILGISKYHTNTNTLIGLHWPTVKNRILLRKLGFLAKLLSSESGISTQVFQTLSTDNVYEISLVQQCRLLEQYFDTNYLGVCLENSTDAARAIQEAKSVILRKDWNCTVREARTHPSLTIVCATDFITASWNSIWDQALEFLLRLSVPLTSSQQVGTAPGTKHLNLVFVAQS